MSRKKVLIVGASENVVDESNQLYHYDTLLRQHYNVDITNVAIGAMSNDEIFYRCVENIEQHSYDCVIVMWAGLDRKWIYFADNNVDDFTIMHPAFIKGFQSTNSNLIQYQKLHWAYFNNRYISLRNWLSQVITLQNTLAIKNMPYVMIHDFDNHLTEMLNCDYSKENGFTNLSTEFKTLLDFDNRPDNYILKKINRLKTLVNKLDRSAWVEFETFRFSESKVDHQTDGWHAGPLTHQIFFNKLTNQLNKQNIIF